jgi:hypothetical protein
MRQFFQTVKNSIYNPQFYKDIEQEKMVVSVKYFAKLAFFVACVVAIFPIVGGIGLLTWKSDMLADARMQVVETFPQELVFQINHGQISTNVNEPYAIALPDAIRKELASDDDLYSVSNLIVINTQKPIEVGDFQEYETAVILGGDEIGIFDVRKGKLQIQSLKKFDMTYTLDRTSFESLVATAWRIGKIIGVVALVLLPFLIFAGLLIGYAVYLLFGALFIWLAAKVTQKSLTYKQSYKLGLHLVTLPLIASFVLSFLLHMPFMFTLVLFATAFANFRQSSCKCDAREESATDEKKDVAVMPVAQNDENFGKEEK